MSEPRPPTRGFCDPFDAALAVSGPPAIFGLDHDGLLRLEPNRTRDAWQRLEAGGAPVFEVCHCVYTDGATRWPQYFLVTSPALCASHPRATIERFPDQTAALEALDAAMLRRAGPSRAEEPTLPDPTDRSSPAR